MLMVAPLAYCLDHFQVGRDLASDVSEGIYGDFPAYYEIRRVFEALIPDSENKVFVLILKIMFLPLSQFLEMTFSLSRFGKWRFSLS